MGITCRVVSPERPLFEGEVERLVAPGSKGELGIYPLHAPLIAKLAPGVLRLHVEGGTEKMAVRGGFIQVKDEDVTVLVTRAARPEDIDRGEIASELAEVLEALRHPSSEAEFEKLLDRRTWLQTCLKILGSDARIAGARELAKATAPSQSGTEFSR